MFVIHRLGGDKSRRRSVEIFDVAVVPVTFRFDEAMGNPMPLRSDDPFRWKTRIGKPGVLGTQSAISFLLKQLSMETISSCQRLAAVGKVLPLGSQTVCLCLTEIQEESRVEFEVVLVPWSRRHQFPVHTSSVSVVHHS